MSLMSTLRNDYGKEMRYLLGENNTGKFIEARRQMMHE